MELLERVQIADVASGTAPRPTAQAVVIPMRHGAFGERRPLWRESLLLVERHLAFVRRTLRAGDTFQTAGDAFRQLHIVNLGVVKTVSLAANGREQLAGPD